LRNDERGNALVEIALTLPIFLGLLTAVLSFGVAFSNQLTLTHAVGSGAQRLQQIRTSTSDPCADTLTAITSAAPTLKPSNISLTLNLNGTTVSGTSCSGYQSYIVLQQPVTVTASYPCSLSVYGVSMGSSCRLGAQVTEYAY